ncbi:MAG TPA: bifunctional 4-hydroxy-2-oxoglutarate aldolase/2-dehydro-3-deoxy-phosphogluconate aldolase [Clostridiaceae bacterium]|nr:bifunctional 4-hydroxy-2-oxoglutarate aldolase/2-dehydro-3-deoxy-phosphogluconate aldolase [Clostridiaceae bacterium]
MSIKQRVKDSITENKLIAIIRNVDESHIEPTIQALYDGGIRLIEIAFDSSQENFLKNTSELIKSALALRLPDLTIGAGTVISLEILETAISAGAQYILSPSYSKEIIKNAQKNDIVTIPGCFSPSEIVDAYSDGADFIKLFPAHRLGPDYIKDLRGPIGRIPLIAVGGINDQNCLEYIQAGAVGVGMGSNLVNPEIINRKEYHLITNLAQTIVNKVHSNQ